MKSKYYKRTECWGWHGEWTPYLEELFDRYKEKNRGRLPDGYEEVDPDFLDYKSFVRIIEYALENNVSVPYAATMTRWGDE